MDDIHNTTLSYAKMEYTTQLVEILTPHIFDGVKSIYDEAKIVKRTNKTQTLLFIFRSMLEKVPEWNHIVIDTETSRIIKLSSCDWLDDLLTAVFISHTKILSSIGNNNELSNIDLTIPKTTDFIHKTYVNIAREIWKNPYLFDDTTTGSIYQQNMRTVELMIKECIESTIRKLLPIKEILKQHLDTYETNNAEIAKRNNENDLRKMLLEEIQNLSKPSNDVSDKIDESTKQDIQELVNHVINDTNNKNESYSQKGEGLVEDVEPTSDIEEDKEYESPDEEEIQQKCEGLEINTLETLDPVVEVSQVVEPNPENSSKVINIEEEYDNVEIIKESPKETTKNKSMLQSFMNSLFKDKEDVDEGVDEDNDEPPPLPERAEEVVEPVKEEVKEEVVEVKEVVEPVKEVVEEVVEPVKEVVEEVVEVKEEEPLKEEVVEPVKEPLKEEVKEEEPSIKVIKTDDSEDTNVPASSGELTKEDIPLITVERGDDNETVDNFYNDLSRIMENKGISVKQNAGTYTLFDDAIEE